MHTKEIIDLIRIRIGDVNKANGIPAPIYMKNVNQAIDDILEDNGGIFAEYTRNSVDGTADYVLPSLVKDVEWVYYDGHKLPRYNHEKFYRDEVADPTDWAEGTPEYYMIRYVNGSGLVITLYPQPNASTYEIRIGTKIRYTEQTTSNWETDLVLPNETVNAIADYATYLTLKDLGDPEKAMYWKQLATEAMIKSRPTRDGTRKAPAMEID